jgi:hypothetical protein
MSATARKGLPDLERLAERAGEINRAQAAAGELLPETSAFVGELADRFGSAGEAPAPADAHDEILFYRALTDAQRACGDGDRRRVRIALQRVQDSLAQIVRNDPVREGRDANDVARWLADALADVSGSGSPS